ncbi:MAG: nuclear transport factor 2 family protein [Chryseolinea sp.]
MKKLAFSLISAAIWTTTYAQFANPDLNAIVAAENAFSKMAKDKNTRDAFLYFLHDDAVTTTPNGPATGKERLRKQQPNASLLSWEVSFGDISSAGDLGYDTGPWKFYPTRTDTVPVAWGHFHSIWKKQPDGTWKNMLDIGIAHDSLVVAEQLHTSSLPLKVPAVKVSALDATVSLMNQEKAFLAAVKLSGNAAYGPVASKEIRFARQGEQPITTTSDKEQFLKRISLYSHQTLVDGGIASSGDLGYVYGTANVVAMVNGNEESKRATYLRIWKKEGGKDWKIVLDVMTYN